MAGLPLNFLPPIHLFPNLKMFPLHYMAEILRAQVLHAWPKICVKLSAYNLKLSHNTPITDRRTDGWTDECTCMQPSQ